ncbi:hypothetical protein [Deinococcus oregonensis]|uniref:hypothetical protein n=1 Tax=Deinococcus oregonensis TaxID=1805970 RepID=UPI0036D2D431
MRYERNRLPISEDLGQLTVGGRSSDDLRLALSTSGVALNESAELLLNRPEILMPEPVELSLVAVSIAALGLGDGGCLEEVFTAALEQGLALCPLATAVHLRLVHTERESSDPELRRQRPPEGALNIGSPILDPNVELPKGFYLRTVNGQRWLRGYQCDLAFVLPPAMTYVFARAEHS